MDEKADERVAQVRLAGPVARYDVATASGSGGCLSYDDANRKLLAVQDGKVLSWCLDQDKRTDKEIEFVEQDDPSLLVWHKLKTLHSIVGFFWTKCNASNFVVVTTNGVELYRVRAKERQVDPREFKKHKVAWCIYSHEPRLLLLAKAKGAGRMYGYQFTAHECVKLPKFYVDESTLEPRKEDFTTLVLYSRIYCCHFDRTACKLSLYHLFRDTIVKEMDVPVYSAHVRASAVDNTLIVHAMQAKVPIVLDVYQGELQMVSTPLPIGVLLRGKRRNDFVMEVYGDGWEFLAPDLVLDRRAGLLWSLTLDLQGLAESTSEPAQLAAFLQRRDERRYPAPGPRALTLRLVETMLVERAEVSALSAVFNVLAAACSAAAQSAVKKPDHEREGALGGPESPCIPACMMLERVFDPLESEGRLEGRYLLSALTEYMWSMEAHAPGQCDPALYAKIVSLSLRMGSHEKLYQLFRPEAMPPTHVLAPLADLLLSMLVEEDWDPYSASVLEDLMVDVSSRGGDREQSVRSVRMDGDGWRSGEREGDATKPGTMSRASSSAEVHNGSVGGSVAAGSATAVAGSSRVDRLLRERQLRRSRSSQNLFVEEEAPASPKREERLLIVANRLPVSGAKDEDGKWTLKNSSGGLVSAMMGVQHAYVTRWIGWPGMHLEPGPDRDELDQLLRQEGYVPVWFDEKTVDLYYNGYCNQVLWQLFHYVPLPLEARLSETRTMQAQWAAYQEANRRFAQAVVEEYDDGDLVWCHDYHVVLLPQMLKQLCPDMKLGFFIHTPFPSSEIYRTLPMREELLRGLLSADLIGFHTYDYARHFVSACTRILGLEGTPEGVEDSGQITRIAAFPIGIDPARFSQALDSEKVKFHIAELRKRFAGRKVMLGVDRLDMIKGIPQKLLAYEKFLDENPSWKDKVLLVQIAVPTRMDVPEYQQLRSLVHEIVGRINGKFGTLTHVPIHHLDRSLEFHELVALYAVTDVCLVTSLRDGMNLVSYEYVACQKQNSGVLILSEFAGAAQSLGAGALLVNPHNVIDITANIEDALTMSGSERKDRQRQNYMHVTTHTAQEGQSDKEDEWIETIEASNMDWMESVQLVFDYFCERTPRSYVDRRETSMVWNYKYADPEFGRLQARDMLQHLWTGPISNAAVDIVQGGRSVEARYMLNNSTEVATMLHELATAAEQTSENAKRLEAGMENLRLENQALARAKPAIKEDV
eukprot:jgi/Pico_ML_1/54112/g4535.t1